jgi:CRP/FNR family transcriptional regulator, cyclic AMP receptor protein
MVCQVDVDRLARTPLLCNLLRQEVEQLAAAMQSRAYRRAEVVFHQGDPGLTLHLVCQGHLKIVRCSPAGAEAVLAIVGPGDLFGEMAVLDGGPRSATVVALESVETATLHRADLLGLLRRSPAAVEGLLATLVGTIRKANESAADLMFLDQSGLLAKKLVELAEVHGWQATDHQLQVELPLTQEELAAMIGATRNRVNQLLGRYEAQGIIALGRRRIVIRNVENLRRRAIA